MSIRIGPIEPLQLVFNVLNTLLKKGLISVKDAEEIIKGAMQQELSDEEKEKIYNSLIKKG